MKQHSLPRTSSCQKLLLAFLSAFTLFIFAPQLVARSFAETTTLAWDANSESDLAGYKIYYSSVSANGPFTGTGLVQGTSPITVGLNSLGTPSSPSFQLSGLTAGNSYYFAVTAYNKTGTESSYSNVTSYTVPMPITYTLTASKTGQGSISPAGSISILKGESKTFIIAPDQNYQIADVKVDGASVGPVAVYIFNNIAASHTIEALFAINTFSITASAGANGTISPAGVTSATFGTSKTYTISPNANCRISDVAVNGASIGPVGSYTFSNISTAQTIQATFAINTFSITAAAGTNGIISPAGAVKINSGSAQVYVISPDTGYEVSDVKVNGTSVGAVTSYIFSNVTANNSIDASFKKIPAKFSMEFGEVNVDSNWKKVSLTRHFTNPVVVATSMSFNDPSPAVVRIDNVTPTGFEISIQEWDYLDDNHALEIVGYVVIEAGSFILPDGSVVEAGTFETKAISSFQTISFSNKFSKIPVVFANVTSYNDPDAVAIRIQNISTNKFECRMQEEEANIDGHPLETVSFIAWEPCNLTMDGIIIEAGTSEQMITNLFSAISFTQDYSSRPIFLASIQTTNEADVAALRWKHRNLSNIQLGVQEEQSMDSEMIHAPEVVGFLTIANDSEEEIYGDGIDNNGDGQIDEGYILSQNQSTTASASETTNLIAAKAVDGDPSTRWASIGGVDSQWIYVDLGKTAIINRVVLDWEAAYGKAYQIQVSNDAVNWTTIYSETNSDGGIDDLRVSGTGRFVRMFGTARGTRWGYSLWEFEVYGAIPGPTSPQVSVLLTPGKQVMSSANENTSFTAVNAVDGNPSTRWASAMGIDPQWICVDLGQTATINRVVLNWEAAYGKAYQIQVSNDAVTWTTIYSETNGNGGIDDLTVSGTGRFVRMYGTARSTRWGYSLWEFEVYGTIFGPTSSQISVLLTPGKQVMSSANENTSFTAVNAVDGNSSTRWASAMGLDPQWICVDLGQTATINRVVLNWEAAYGKAYQIQVSNDAVTWTTIYSETKGNGGIDDLMVSGIGRYVRMYGTTRSTRWGYSLWEFEVYGFK